MSQEDQIDLFNDKEQNVRNSSLDKQRKKKTRNFSAWDKLRENVSSGHSNDTSCLHEKAGFTNTTLVAAQAAGMSNFVRNFKSKVAARRQNGAIYATSTAVQQDIYRLERDLEKLLNHMNSRSQTSSDDSSIQTGHTDTLNGLKTTCKSKKAIFNRYSQAISDPSFENDSKFVDVTRISANITSIMDIIKKYKAATRLPFTSEILTVLSIPFDKKPQKIEDCTQALDTFDYIRDRFTLLDSTEHFEQIIFCSTISGSSNVNLKERVLNTLKTLVQPCYSYPSYLPSAPSALHTLVYSLSTSFAKQTLDFELRESRKIYDFVYSELLSLLDHLSEGKLISIQGRPWDEYYHTKQASSSLSRMATVESLCKCLMVSVCRQTVPREKSTEFLGDLIQKDQQIPALLELIQRYWSDPDLSTVPVYYTILSLMAELASEISLNISIENTKSSAIPELLVFIVEKVAPFNIQKHADQKLTAEKKNTKSTISHVVTMILCILSIRTSERPPPLLTSPSLSLQSSFHEFPAGSPFLDDSEIPQIQASTKDTVLITIIETSKRYLIELWNSGFESEVLKCTEAMLQDVEGDRVATFYQNLLFHTNAAIGETVAKRTMPILFKRILDNSPLPTTEFCGMLRQLSQSFKPYFYKPIVSCVASDDNEKVAHLLKLMTHLRKYLTGVQFWMQDAEMINVLLLSDVGAKKLQKEQASNVWGSTTLGQCVVTTELILVLRSLREKQKNPTRHMEEDEIAKKFLIDLERRLALFLTAKEKKSMVPLPLRVLLCNLFMDLRFFCYTTHKPGWLTCAINWAIQPTDQGGQGPPPEDFELIRTLSENVAHTSNSLPTIDSNSKDNIPVMFQRMQNVYLDVIEYFSRGSFQGAKLSPSCALFGNETPRHARRHLAESMYPIGQSAYSALDLSPPDIKSDGEEETSLVPELANYRFSEIEKINQDPFGSVFSLLAAVYTTLSSQEYGRLAKPLWENYMDDKKPTFFTPAVFLLMECGEKVPKLLSELFVQPLQNKDSSVRLNTIQKFLSLTGFRLNTLKQSYIQVSSHNKPFRGDGGAFSTPFVPTDLGSNEFSLDEPRWMSKLRNTSNLPIELKKQIQELGWNEDDNAEEHEALKKVLTPLGLLPSLFLENKDEQNNEDEHPSIAAVNERGKVIDISKIIRRRKRAATVQVFATTFLVMVDLLTDNSAGVANVLRELIEQFSRDDPALFLRPFLNTLGDHEWNSIKNTLTRIRYIINTQRKLSPGLTHIMFNYLAGMLKWIVRENQGSGLKLMTLVHPLLAELALSTNDLSVRDLRKNKIEHLLVSTGKFWFTHEQPADMFPRFLTTEQHDFAVLNIPEQIFSVASLRISHIQFLTNYLVRFPREVYAVKKSLQDYEPIPIPGAKWNTRGWIENAYYPDITCSKTQMLSEKQPRDCQQLDREMLSAMRARIWLRFIDMLLNSLNKNYNDREELERILQGVNIIIAEHSRDFAILGQALVLYTRVVTRFKRLFKSNRGYTIFLSALFKTFCEAETAPQITSAVIFTWCRFYAVHEESFVFQMLGSLVPSILTAYGKSEKVGQWMIENMFILMQAMDSPPHLGSTPDILGLQLQVELDDHERNIQDRIDSVSSQTTLKLSSAIFKPLARGANAPITQIEVSTFSNRPFKLEDFIKLFLTVIAYDPGSLRAEQFVKIFTYLIPFFVQKPQLKNMMQEGVSALVNVFTKFSKNAKSVVTTSNARNAPGEYQNVPSSDSKPAGFSYNTGSKAESAQNAYGKQWQQNDRFTIKQNFIALVHEYLKHGGTLSEVSHEKMAQIIRTVFRDYRNIKGMTIKTDWIKDYLVVSLHSMTDTRNYTKSLKKVLNEIYTQYRAQWKTVDASDLYEGLAVMLEKGQGKAIMMDDLAEFIREKFVSFGLNVATLSHWQNDPKGPIQFCNSLVRLIIAILENSRQDVFAEIERQSPSFELLGRIVIPLCLQYNLQWNYSSTSISNASARNSANHWARFLNYLANVCSQTFLLKTKSSGFSLSQLTNAMGQAGLEDNTENSEFPEAKDGKQTPGSVAVLFSLSLVAIKIVLIRCQNTFNELNGSWSQIASFIRNTLVFGQTLKLLRTKSTRSEAHTPLEGTSAGPPSPSVFSPLGLSSPGVTPYIGNQSLPQMASSAAGAIHDFTTWKFLEFIVYYRTPLFVLLKDFIYEKMNGAGPIRSSLYSPRTSVQFLHHENPRSRTWSAEGSSGLHDASPSMPSTPKRASPHPDNTEPDVLGLGLHRPGPSARAPPSSPGALSDQESPCSPKQAPFHESSTPKESVLQGLYAETVTSMIQVQVAIGSKPALPWMATSSKNKTKPWSHQSAVAKMANEWQLLLQVFTELDVVQGKAAVSASSTHIPTALLP
ncbi:hypothetical protein BY458DRAFT_554083 [Sporodiniella umbellata]|nr:hypothetical protein BY458DRAFT_554083 [Sporodiniella umbellata]